jgi:uncharacterized ubiquitin-like protein YukD
LDAVPKIEKCPECNTYIDTEMITSLRKRLQKFTHEDMFSYQPPTQLPPSSSSSYVSTSSTIQQISFTVNLLGGQSVEIKLPRTSKIRNIMDNVRNAFSIDVSQQRLVYHGQELKEVINGKRATLEDYNITEGSNIQLMKLMLSQKKISLLQNIDFVLSWGWGRLRKAYLDGMCFVYNGADFAAYIDYKSRWGVGISHSGNVVNSFQKTTIHRITVELESLGPETTHLFFVLSAVFVDTIRDFDDPGVRLYDHADRNTQLSGFDIVAHKDSQAVIMCCLRRIPGIGWEVVEINTPSRGTVFDYTPIQQQINRLFNKGLV